MEFMWRAAAAADNTNVNSIWVGNYYYSYYYSVVVITLLFLSRFLLLLFNNTRRRNNNNPCSQQPNNNNNNNSTSSDSSSDDVVVINDLDLKNLIHDLNDDNIINNNKWEKVVVRSNDSLSYSVKSCKPNDGGPLKYLSTTVFNSCSSEMLRDFYMDNFYRKEWDNTLIDYNQLHIDRTNGTEIGRLIKKFPLLTPREYILAWRLWEGTNRTYYCYSKECDHPLAPRLKKYVRVGLLRSGWRIREVPGRNSCEIKMVHQEDAGLNAEMAKVIFAKGIWSYVCKMDNALRKYSDIRRLQLNSVVSAITLVQKVPPSLDSVNNLVDITHPEVSAECSEKKISRKPSKRFIANGLIIVGGVICLARGHTNFSGKVAMGYMLSKLTQRRQKKQLSLQ